MEQNRTIRGNGIAEDSFFKVGDDCLKLFCSGMRVRHCVVWQLDKAACFEIGVNVPNSVVDVRATDVDVIPTEYYYAGRTNAVFATNYGVSGNMRDYVFSDIRVENASWQLFAISVMPNIDKSSAIVSHSF